jgi:hypothetical protein
MDWSRHCRAALAAILATAALTTGCSPATSRPAASSTLAQATLAQATSPQATSAPGTSSPAGQPAGPAATSGRHGGGRRPGNTTGTGSTVAGGLPADWPPDVPIPAGSIRGSTGSAGRWTVLVSAAGSAGVVLRSAAALYTSAGFTPVSGSVLNKGRRQVTLVVENLDHSPTQTSLVVGVTTR